MRFITFARIEKMKVWVHILMLVALCLMLLSCKKNESALPSMFISPSSLEITTSSGEVVQFSVNIEAEAGLSKLKVFENVNAQGSEIFFDTTFNSEKAVDVVVKYTMPQTFDSTSVLLIFKAYDTENNLASNSRRLTIASDQLSLTEIKNIRLYSGFSDSTNGYLIYKDSLLNSDSTYLGDLDIVTLDTNDKLLRQWSSPIGNTFVKYNSFNYDSATQSSISKAYQFGVPSTKISSLNSGDIILVKLSNPIDYQYSIIKLTTIKEDTGAINDYYEFSIKK